MAEEAALPRACPGALLDTNHNRARKFHTKHQPSWTVNGADESNLRVGGQPPSPLPFFNMRTALFYLVISRQIKWHFIPVAI